MTEGIAKLQDEGTMQEALSISELQRLSRVSSSHSVALIALHWLSVFLPLSLAARFHNVWVWSFVFVWMSRCQVGFLVLTHEATHRRLFRSAFWNDWVGQHLLASAIGFSLPSFRKTHFAHHRNPMTPEDPDIRLTGGYPISLASFLRKLIRDLLGITFVKFHSVVRRADRESAKRVVLSTAILQFFLFAAFWSLGASEVFLFLWIFPQMTLTQCFFRWRGVAEHAGYAPSEDQRFCTRTVTRSLGSFFLSPYGASYHLEHHLYPSVPCHRLPELHTILSRRNLLPKTQVFSSYFFVFRTLPKMHSRAKMIL
jgi:fatty acid desaturase